jgi:hypothetical protein
MSRWILQSTANDAEPISFEQLAQMIADDVVQETDIVRPENALDWQSIDSVVGLCRTADKLRRLTCPDGAAVAGLETAVVTTSAGVGAGASIDAARSATPRDRKSDVRPIAENAAEQSKLSNPVSWTRVLTLCVIMALIAWGAWWFWMVGRRFPRPAHFAANAQPWTLPWLGPVNEFEIAMLAFDVAALTTFVVWWFRTKRPAG